MTVVRDQLFPQKPPGSRFRFSRTGVQPSPGSSTIELPSAFAESGAYPPDREPPGSPRQCSLPLACRHPPEGHQIGARKRRTPENTILSQPYCRRVSTDRSDREGSQLAASLEGEPGPTPAGKTLPHSYPETRFRRERARDVGYEVPTELPGSTGFDIIFSPCVGCSEGLDPFKFFVKQVHGSRHATGGATFISTSRGFALTADGLNRTFRLIPRTGRMLGKSGYVQVFAVKSW